MALEESQEPGGLRLSPGLKGPHLWLPLLPSFPQSGSEFMTGKMRNREIPNRQILPSLVIAMMDK